MKQKTLSAVNEHILLVDNEVSVLIMLKKILVRKGYRVTTGKDSTSACRVFMADPRKFDLVITDLNLPDINGDMLARRFLQIRADIPIILYSGNSGFISQEKAGKSDFKGFLIKPFTMKELTDTICKVLNP